jgi:hypothetical protein
MMSEWKLLDLLVPETAEKDILRKYFSTRLIAGFAAGA